MILYVCETCGTFSQNDPHPKHDGHNVMGIKGDDRLPNQYDSLSRLAAVHILMANKRPDVPSSIEFEYVRVHADWFDEDMSVYD